MAFLQVATLVLFLVHLYAFAVFAVILAGFCLAEVREIHSRGLSAKFRAATKIAIENFAPFVMPFLILITISRTSSSWPEIAYTGPGDKVIMAFNSLVPELSIQSLAIVLAALVPVVVLRLGRSRRIHPRATWAVILPLGLFCIMPSVILGSANADWRVLMPALLVLTGAVAAPSLSANGTRAMIGLVVLVNTIASANVWSLWRTGDQYFEEFTRVTSALPRGARLIPVFSSRLEARQAMLPPSTHHYATYAVATSSALVPSLFANPDHQPIALREPFDKSVDWSRWFNGGPQGRIRTGEVAEPCNFALHIIPRPAAKFAELELPVPAEEIARSEHFVLYRLSNGSEAAGSSLPATNN